MRKSVTALVMLGGVIICAVIFLNRQNPLRTAPIPVVESETRQKERAGPEKIVAPKYEEPRMGSHQPVGPAAIPRQASASDEMQVAGADTALIRTVDALVSAQTSFSDRQAMWQKLKDAGQLDPIIAELKQRAAGHPLDPAIPTAIGEALMHKFPIADSDESAMTGLQMDQSFNKALKLDPANWEAQFFKAATMAYWPAEMNKAPEVVQRFSALIDQQETMPAQPEFAQAYVLLGNQYQKMGQADKAAATWQLGLMKFPYDPMLQKKVSAK
jgi:hypothetical protein